MNLAHIKKIQLWIKVHFLKPYDTNPESLGFFRIATSLLLIMQMCAVAWDFQKLYGKNGIIPSDIQEVYLPNYIMTFPKLVGLLESYNIHEQVIIKIFIFIFLALAIFLLVGFITRVAALVLLFLYISISSGMYKYGVDSFMTSALFYLFVFPSGNFLSVDSRLRSPKLINITPYKRVIQFHLSVVYFFSGLAKSFGVTWWNGEAIWKSIHLPGANELFGVNLDFLGHFPILAMVSGWAVVILELFYPLFINLKITRPIWFYGIISMHVGIALILNLYFFAAIMIILNVTAYGFKAATYVQKK